MTGRARHRGQRGFSLIELMIGIALSGLFAGALFSFFNSSTEANRTHEAQTRSQASARLALARLSGDVRQAAGPDGTAPVVAISAYELIVYVDARRSADPTLSALPRRVRYALESGSLVREEAVPTVGAGGALTYPAAYSGRETMATGIVNAANAVPVFAGVGSSGTAASVPANVAQVAVRIQVGHQANQRAVVDEVTLDITLRNA